MKLNDYIIELRNIVTELQEICAENSTTVAEEIKNRYPEKEHDLKIFIGTYNMALNEIEDYCNKQDIEES